MRIATEEDVAVTVEGVPDSYAARPLAGFLVISEEDLARLLENTETLRAVRAALKAKATTLEALLGGQ